MRNISLKAGLAAAIIAVSAVGASAASPSLTPLQINALENHDAMSSPVAQHAVKVSLGKPMNQKASRYDTLEREAWQARQ